MSTDMLQIVVWIVSGVAALVSLATSVVLLRRWPASRPEQLVDDDHDDMPTSSTSTIDSIVSAALSDLSGHVRKTGNPHIHMHDVEVILTRCVKSRRGV